MAASRFRICRMLIICFLLLISTFFLSKNSGCNSPDFFIAKKQNCWEHYNSGGIFLNNSGNTSPDGTSIIFSSPQTGHGDIWRFDLQEKVYQQLTATNDCDSYPLFSPNGSNIVFSRESRGYRHIYLLSMADMALIQLTSGDVIDTPLQFSFDGERILFLRQNYIGNYRGIQNGPVMCIFLSEAPNYTPKEVGNYGVFCPNGDLVFSSLTVADGIGISSFEKEETESITSGKLEDVSPVSGKYICLTRNADVKSYFNRDIVVFDIDTKSEKKIAEGLSPRFMPDERGVVYFKHNPWSLWYYDIENDKVLRIGIPSGYMDAPQMCLDKSGVLIRVYDGSRIGDIYHIFNDLSFKKIVSACTCPTAVRDAKNADPDGETGAEKDESSYEKPNDNDKTGRK